MKDNYDFSDGVKNPYAEKLKQGYTITVHYDFTDKDKGKEDTDHDKSAEKDLPQNQA